MTVENCTDPETTTKVPYDSHSSDSSQSRESYWNNRHNSGDSSSRKRALLGSRSPSSSDSGSSSGFSWNKRCLYPDYAVLVQIRVIVQGDHLLEEAVDMNQAMEPIKDPATVLMMEHLVIGFVINVSS